MPESGCRATVRRYAYSVILRQVHPLPGEGGIFAPFTPRELVVRQGISRRQVDNLIESMRFHVEQKMPSFEVCCSEYVQTLEPHWVCPF